MGASASSPKADRGSSGSALGIIAVAASILCLGALAQVARADTWTGAGETPLNQVRNWGLAGNWLNGAVPLGTDVNTFDIAGDGTVQLQSNRIARGMVFNDFTSTVISGPAAQTLSLQPDGNNNPVLTLGEGLRDTYGSDYFTVGPDFKANLTLAGVLSIGFTPGVKNSAMIIEGQLISGPSNNVINYNGTGTGASLWVASNNNAGSPRNRVVLSINNGGGSGDGAYGYTLHLADSMSPGSAVTAGRLDNIKISLNSSQSYLGLHPAAAGNQYANDIDSLGGNIFTDRSYQGNDLANNVNYVQTISGTLTLLPLGNGDSQINFGTADAPGQTGQTPFGRTNNGYGISVTSLTSFGSVATVNVNNGNLTEDRAGSRYLSGANRLQEAHNYTYVDNYQMSVGQSLVKGGAGVLVISAVNNGQGFLGWATVDAGVLSGAAAALSSSSPGVSLSANAAVGVRWNTAVSLSVSFPVPVSAPAISASNLPGQCGALDIDLAGHNMPIDTTIGTLPGFPTSYLRVGSSQGGDASFDAQPSVDPPSPKHASTSGWIAPYFSRAAMPQHAWYYFGGGGGTLRVDHVLADYYDSQFGTYRTTNLEMGTTGSLLPGRVALKPMSQGQNSSNYYTGQTDVKAGTLQLLNAGAVAYTSGVSLGTYDQGIIKGLYDYPNTGYSWQGPGMLLIDPAAGGGMNLEGSGAYLTGVGYLRDALSFDGGVLGWTGNVTLTESLPRTYNALLVSDLNPARGSAAAVLGLGGEYSAGVMTGQFQISDAFSGQIPVLLYKAGKNSVLDLSLRPPTSPNTYTGGTIIAGGEIKVSDASQLNAAAKSENGGPILILNGGRLHIVPGGQTTDFYVPIMINTAGTPDLKKNCGSVLQADTDAALKAPFDFRWNPGGYLEKTGSGTLTYAPTGTVTPGAANAWGLKLTGGTVAVDQMPLNPSPADPNELSGPVIFNNGSLNVRATSVSPAQAGDPAYGFRNIVSFKGTSSLVTVADGGLFRIHGSVPNEIMGTVTFLGEGAADPSNRIVQLSRNMAPATSTWPADDSRGTGILTFAGVTVYMTDDPNTQLGSLPNEAGFMLQLNSGVVFRATRGNSVGGAVYFSSDADPNQPDPSKFVKIDGARAAADRSSVSPDVWTISGTGQTLWEGVVEKIGSGTVAINRDRGAPVTIGYVSTALPELLISGGTLQAGGTADPFTQTPAGTKHVNIRNNATFEITAGEKAVGTIDGSGATILEPGTELEATCVYQDTLTLKSTSPADGARLVIRAISDSGAALDAGNAAEVPEPGMLVLLGCGGPCLIGLLRRRRGGASRP